jgi:uncharacterized protein DUF3800
MSTSAGCGRTGTETGRIANAEQRPAVDASTAAHAPPMTVAGDISSMMTRYTAYCDESGHTGGNFLDPTQPIYAIGGWLVPTTQTCSAEAVVARIARTLAPQASELHGHKHLRTHKGRVQAKTLFQGLRDLGSVPVFIVAEKRYVVAAKAVHTFLDPVHNPKVPNQLFNSPTRLQALADVVYGLGDPAVTQFGQAYRSKNAAELGAALVELIARLRATNRHELAETFHGAAPNIDSIARVESRNDSSLHPTDS